MADYIGMTNKALDDMAKAGQKANEELGKLAEKTRDQLEKNMLIGLKGVQLDEAKAAQLREKLLQRCGCSFRSAHSALDHR